MGHRSTPWTPSAVSLVVVVAGVVVTVALALAARAAHDENEDRLLRQRTREAAAVLQAAVPGLEAPLATSAALAEVVDDDGRGVEVFRRTMGTQVGQGGPFVSLSVWRVDVPTPTIVLGEEPRLASAGDAERRALFRRAVATDGFTIHDLLGSDTPRLGYAFPTPDDAGLLVYAEQALPVDRTAVVQPDSAFDGLEYSLSLRMDGSPDTLLLASTSDLPLRGRVAVEAIPFGDASLRLAVSPEGDLGGSLLARLPLLVLGVGLVMVLVAGALTERLQRRRRYAEVLAEENARLYGEQRAGSLLLQQSLLPRSLPTVAGVEIAVRYVAGVEGTHVGGDWYDVIDKEGSLVVVVGDVSGRGLTAASSMASVRYTVRTLAAEGLSPEEILTRSNHLDEGQGSGHFATVVCGVAHATDRTVTFASAGHPRPLVVAGGDARWLDVPIGPPVGAGAEVQYASSTETLPPGATLLLATDGLFERRDEAIDVGLERFRAAAARAEGPLQSVVDAILAELTGESATDDVAILALRWPA
ncbi:MAG TPA: PP2C family protein-serine/threonine phosphatase [Acidimicrobiales bacterium]|nr:PP2C family protein-serine/threonine phosphatase [Acidimicrobiales bacterium]